MFLNRKPNPEARRNVSLGEESRSYQLFSTDAKDAGQKNFVCPKCGRNVIRLFVIARNDMEAYYKFKGNDCACGFDTATKIADDEMDLIATKTKRK